MLSPCAGSAIKKDNGPKALAPMLAKGFIIGFNVLPHAVLAFPLGGLKFAEKYPSGKRAFSSLKLISPFL